MEMDGQLPCYILGYVETMISDTNRSTIKQVAIFDECLDHGWSMVKLSASELVSRKSVICGDTMQLAGILLALSLINALNIATDTCTKGYLHVHDL